MGYITINKLRINAHHGVLEQERRVGNEFEINVRLNVPCADNAAITDELTDTINYAEIVDIIKKEMAKPSKLIENVALRLRESITSRFDGKIIGGEITVAKLAPPIAAQLESVAYILIW